LELPFQVVPVVPEEASSDSRHQTNHQAGVPRAVRLPVMEVLAVAETAVSVGKVRDHWTLVVTNDDDGGFEVARAFSVGLLDAAGPA
jgi:hypothetical protein